MYCGEEAQRKEKESLEVICAVVFYNEMSPSSGSSEPGKCHCRSRK